MPLAKNKANQLPKQPNPKKPKVSSVLKSKSREEQQDKDVIVTNEEIKDKEEYPALLADGTNATNRWVTLPNSAFPDEATTADQAGWRARITKTKKTTAVSWFFVKVKDSPNGHWFRFENLSECTLLSY